LAPPAFRDNSSFRNVFWNLQQAGTDKELIHPSQFVDCPLLLLEDCFLLLSSSKSLKPLRSDLLAATDTPNLTSLPISRYTTIITCLHKLCPFPKRSALQSKCRRPSRVANVTRVGCKKNLLSITPHPTLILALLLPL